MEGHGMSVWEIIIGVVLIIIGILLMNLYGWSRQPVFFQKQHSLRESNPGGCCNIIRDFVYFPLKKQVIDRIWTVRYTEYMKVEGDDGVPGFVSRPYSQMQSQSAVLSRIWKDRIKVSDWARRLWKEKAVYALFCMLFHSLKYEKWGEMCYGEI